MLYWFVHKCSKGFTQIELAVIVVIVGVLAAIAAPNLLGWYRQQQVDTALVQIDTALQEAQNEAVKRHQSCSVSISRGENVLLKGTCSSSEHTLNGLEIDHSRKLNDWKITFDNNGENHDFGEDPGTLWISSRDSDVRKKCLVISFGIGLRRTGNYENKTCVTR